MKSSFIYKRDQTSHKFVYQKLPNKFKDYHEKTFDKIVLQIVTDS